VVLWQPGDTVARPPSGALATEGHGSKTPGGALATGGHGSKPPMVLWQPRDMVAKPLEWCFSNRGETIARPPGGALATWGHGSKTPDGALATKEHGWTANLYKNRTGGKSCIKNKVKSPD
jgi:hypothetical protein